MNVFRKLMLATLAGVVLMMPLTVSSRVQADPARSHTRYYYVYYRTCPGDPWYYYATYARYTDAEYAVYYLRYYGYQAYFR